MHISPWQLYLPWCQTGDNLKSHWEMGSLSFHTVKRSLALDVNYCNMGCAGVAERPAIRAGDRGGGRRTGASPI